MFKLFSNVPPLAIFKCPVLMFLGFTVNAAAIAEGWLERLRY
jgi:hypothetical protein